MNPLYQKKQLEILERLVNSAVGLKLANARDYKEFVPTAQSQLDTLVEETVLGITEPIYREAFNRGGDDPVYVAMVNLRSAIKKELGDNNEL